MPRGWKMGGLLAMSILLLVAVAIMLGFPLLRSLIMTLHATFGPR